MVRTKYLLIFFILILLSLSGCTAGESPETGGTLVVGQSTDVEILDPHRHKDLYAVRVSDQLFDKLVMLNHQGEFKPSLATSWTVHDDGMRWRFQLRNDVVFHDGEPMTADDVVFSLNRVLDPEFESPHKGDLGFVREVRAEETHQVSIELEEPNGALLSALLNVHVVPEHAADRLNEQPVGSGPFVFEERQADERIVLKAFNDYWAGAPMFSELVFRPIPETSTRLVELETGRIHIADGIPGEEMERLTDLDGVEVASTVGSNYSVLAFNNERSPFDDPRVRRAVGKAIDAQRLVELVYPGTAVAAEGPIPPTSWAYDDSFEGLGFDLGAARRLMDEADVDQDLSVELMISEDERMERGGVLLKSMLEEIGMDIDLTALEWGTFMERMLGRDYDMLRVAWSTDPDPDALLYGLHHSGSEMLNFTRYQNPQADELLDRGRRQADVSARAESYREFQEIVLEDVPMVYLLHENQVVGHRKGVNGFRPHLTGAFYFKTGFGVNTWLRQ